LEDDAESSRVPRRFRNFESGASTSSAIPASVSGISEVPLFQGESDACFRYEEEVEEAATARRVLEELDRLGLPYERIPIDPEHADTATFCDKYGYPLDRSANTIIVASKKDAKRYAACVVELTRAWT
jgi:hypothetical protein